MPQALARKIVLAATVLVAAVLLVIFIGLPFVASTQIVRDHISHQLTAWSGYRVSINGAPEVQIWPSFRAVLKDVKLQDWDEANSKPVLEAEQIEIDLSALAALRGEVIFTRIHLIRPVLRIRDDLTASQLPTPESWGRIARSVLTAKSVVAASPAKPDLQAFPSDKFGEIIFNEARIVTSVDDTSTDLVTSLDGELDWPALNREATLIAKGIWQGESVALQVASAQPLLLLAGGTAPLSFSLAAAPATMTFRGMANLSGTGLVDGDFELTAPSLNRLAEWTRTASLPSGRIGLLAITARLSGDANRLKFEASNLTVDTNTGRGLLEMKFKSPHPSITGTLAFNTLNLLALTTALNPLDQTNASMPAMGYGFDFDLRLSATTANFGSVTLSEVAAAAKGTDQLVSFDITDAMGFGGNFQAGIRADRTSDQQQVQLRLNGKQIDIGNLAQSFGREHLIPQAKADLSVVLKGSGRNINSLLSTADGEVSATFGPGRLPGINLKTLAEEAEKGDFIPLDRSSEGSIPLEGIEIKATLKNGLAQIDQAQIRSGKYTVSLEGRVPVVGRALALSGILTDSDNTTGEELHFFVGGSWNAPFITSPESLRPSTVH